MTSAAGRVALAAAERVERTAGPKAGLAVWRALAANTADDALRGQALVAALRCATSIRDVAAIADLTTRWSTVEHGLWDGAIVALALALEAKGLLPQALLLARAEARRLPSARALYLHARCLDLTPGAEASAVIAAFGEAIARAEKEGAADVVRAARARRAELLARSWTTMPEAIAEADAALRASGASPRTKLSLGRILLASPSRFVRATAIGLLDEVVAGDDARLAAGALAAVARWVDDAGDAITPLEHDRLAALSGREEARNRAPRAAAALAALARIRTSSGAAREAALEEGARLEPGLTAVHRRAQDIAAGRIEPSVLPERAARGPAELRLVRHQEILDVHAALRDRAFARAAHALRRLVDAEEKDDALPREALAAALAALRTEDAELRALAARFFRARLGRARPGAPDEGWLAVAHALAVADEGGADLARHAAAAAKEPGAVELLGTMTARAGWEHARRGEAERALAALRDAKAIFRR